jgi:single-stranded-DNA-specific exonuclease
MPKRWHIRHHDRAAVASLERASGVSSILASLLVARGVTDPAAVQSFLSGTLADLRDPETLPGVPEAAERILAAVKAGRKIAIYGDYDADGMCATAILVGCLQALDATPDRWKLQKPVRMVNRHPYQLHLQSHVNQFYLLFLT